MSPNLKKILMLVALFGVATLIALGMYYAFKKTALPTGPGGSGSTSTAGGSLPISGTRPTSTAGGGGQGGGNGQLPSATTIYNQPTTYYSQPAVTKVTNDYALYTSTDTNGDTRYHNAADGKFYSLQSDGTARPLSDQIFYNVKNVTWAKNTNKAVIEYPDDSKIIYNFNTRTQVSLPKHWTEFTFSPDSSEVAAKSMGLSPENRWLVTTKDDGTGTKLIAALGDNADKVHVDWSPSRQTVALARTGEAVGADRQEVLFVGLNNENFKSTIVEGLDFMPQWSPTGQKLLYSVDSARSNFKPELWVVNAYGDQIGSNRQSLKLNTWANKCTFANDDTLFCAVPRDLPVGAGMSPAVADSIYDDVYRIDLKTGTKVQVPMGDNNYHMTDITYDAKNNKLFFTDGNQRGVFQINL